MRESKFKAWDSKKNDWFDDNEGDLYVELNGSINFGWNGEIMDDYTDRITLKQYTGKKDINGVEIYEGDIVKNGQHAYVVCFVEFADSGDFQYPTKRQTGFYIVDVHTDGTYPLYSMTYEIVGNIYENPDLLED
ncbi:YopX family protein [Jeotgalibaca porci]|uniref:YopX family protein n=1 Tax=Jeotgalibaca porci TaxID=1868793 RepID=UPI00359FBD29